MHLTARSAGRVLRHGRSCAAAQCAAALLCQDAQAQPDPFRASAPPTRRLRPAPADEPPLRVLPQVSQTSLPGRPLPAGFIWALHVRDARYAAIPDRADYTGVVDWDGECRNRMAEGPGRLTIFVLSGRQFACNGVMRQGVMMERGACG